LTPRGAGEDRRRMFALPRDRCAASPPAPVRPAQAAARACRCPQAAPARRVSHQESTP